jgi:hypothetical protein
MQPNTLKKICKNEVLNKDPKPTEKYDPDPDLKKIIPDP